MTPPILSPLTLQDKTILDRLARGWDNKRIARELAIKESQLETTIAAIIEKMAAKTIIRAVAIAQHRGWIYPFAGDAREFTERGSASRWKAP